MSIVIASDRHQLKEIFRELLTESGWFSAAPEVEAVKPARYDELVTKNAQKYLIAKGWQVKGFPAFQRLMVEYNIEGIKRGRNKWYPVSELDKIPNKK